jgi:hypothetical chaperone protein
MPPDSNACCAIDFGTSNSAIALPSSRDVTLVTLESGHTTMPTAVFYAVEGLSPHEEASASFGRAAVAAYVDGVEGRLMRSMKSVLGSTLVDQRTDVGAGRSVAYLDVVSGYLRHLKTQAEAQANQTIERAVLGRPVFFVDDDPVRDQAAQAALLRAAQAVGFRDVQFQLEPIAAALDYESTVDGERLVLVADIGGGTSDFSVVRVGPTRRTRVQRPDDILANHGVHVAGTDFDRRIELAHVLTTCGYGGPAPGGREVPSRVYFDLATWHLINTVYASPRVAELRRMLDFYADKRQHRRLMRVVNQRLGHGLMARAEAAKIGVAEGGQATLDLGVIEAGLRATLDQSAATQALDADMQRIVDAADAAVKQAGLASTQIDALYFTGGSTGFLPLAQRIAARFVDAAVVRGDRFASVATGLGLHARLVFG